MADHAKNAMAEAVGKSTKAEELAESWDRLLAKCRDYTHHLVSPCSEKPFNASAVEPS